MEINMVDLKGQYLKIKDEVEIIGPHINYNDYAKANLELHGCKKENIVVN